MKRGGDIVSLFQKEAMRTGEKKKAVNMMDQTEEPALSMSSVTIEQTKDASSPSPPVYDFSRLKHDTVERIPIASYLVNDQDTVRRAHILKNTFKPYAHDFEKRSIGSRERLFNPLWLHSHSWLEYNSKKKSAFCFVCYLFKEKNKLVVRELMHLLMVVGELE
ncbi:hypothetical protein ZWY2020_057172 [Hordeum vulgare]|nr:hypothetical protein ZWY2020_057172 [Hordeum vulgare]